MSSRNLTLGKGKLYFGEFVAGTQTPAGERFIGNCTEITINADSTELTHMSSTDGRQKKDYSAVLGTDRKGTIVTDDMGFDNLAIFALGIASLVTVSSATALASAFDDVTPGLTYQLGVTTAKPEGTRKISTVLVKDDAGSPVTFVLNTDYTLDADRATVTPIEGGAIDAGTNLRITYDQLAYTVTKVEAGDQKKEGTLRFVSNNPDGPQKDVFIPWAKLSPNGDLNLISAEDWQTLPLAIEVLEKDDLPPWIATGEAA